MSIANLTSTKLELEGLAESIAKGETVLPDFQRDFDWTERDVRALLATVLMGWPAGSLLLMRGEPTFFRVRGFDGGPNVAKDIEMVVLDGQQRLTSIFHALFDKGDYVYAINRKSFDANDVDATEDSIVGYKRAKWESTLRAPAAQVEADLVPLYALRSAADYMGWRDEVLGSLQGSRRDKVGVELMALYKHHLSNINSYQFPVVVVERSLHPGAIARIFERVNRTGMTLGVFDLMVARVYDPKWNLRERWAAECEVHPQLPKFLGEDGTAVLQTIALAEVQNIKRAAVLDLDAKVVRAGWSKAAAAVDSALKVLSAQCGVIGPGWLPYETMLLPIAALSYSGVDLSKHHAILRRWYWDRTFNQTFEVASVTRAVAEYKLLQGAVANRTPIETSSPPGEILLEGTKKTNAALWRGFLCALAAQESTDLLEGVDLGLGEARSQRTGVPARLAIHSLFREQPDLRHRVAASMLLLDSTVAALRSSSLNELLRGATKSLGKEQVNVSLASQFLPDVDALRRLEGFPDKLMATRLRLLSDFVERMTGTGFQGA